MIPVPKQDVNTKAASDSEAAFLNFRRYTHMISHLNPETVLYEKKPAKEWNEAFPLGNGSLGVMISGGVKEETLYLNQESIWSGGPRNRNNPDSLANLSEIRRLIRQGRPDAAEELALYSMAGTPESESVYQPLGTFYLNFDLSRPGRGLPVDTEALPGNYIRTLDLENSVAEVRFGSGQNLTKREHFVSYPAGCFVSRLSTAAPGGVSFSGRFSRTGFVAESGRRTGPSGTALIMKSSGTGNGAVSFAAGAMIIPSGGQMEFLGDHCILRDADEVLILIACRSSFNCRDYEDRMVEDLNCAAEKSWEELFDEHRRDYRKLFCRTELTFGNSDGQKETSERLIGLKNGGEDGAIVPLYFNFGKYLMISSSRPGTLPSNLQGLWNHHDAPPWGSKYTININTQMNYWLAEPCGLGECHTPLFEHILRMMEPGRVTARSMYGCRGFTAHHNTDIWGDTAPQDHWMPATFWCLGGAWLCLHLIEHFNFTRNTGFLEKWYPVLKECALFFEDFLIPAENGELITSPSVSPENTYLLDSVVTARICEGPSMDSQILRELFCGCLEWAGLLDDTGAVERYSLIVSRLPSIKTGEDGRLMEWREEYGEPEPGHRHLSHLFALYPGHQIPAGSSLASGAEKSIRKRLAEGGGHTGWSRAWIVNFWARLGNAGEAESNLKALFTGSTLPNLFCNHPPFQIDGNFGGAAAVAEMLIQSSGGIIRILPALPGNWHSGCLRGVALRGGYRADLSWEAGELNEIIIRKKSGNPGSASPVKILYRGQMLEYNHFSGEELILTSGHFTVR